ncbi:MAG: cupredoxin domain-containing protein [Candidatus Paceibacterota bacterium]
MKSIITSILVAVVLIGGAFIFSKGNPKITNENTVSVNNVIIENGVQIIEIKAKGGYIPRTSIAKAGLPTILRFNTKGTFDCSSSVRIPSLNISQNLPLSGVTDIALPNSEVGTLQGTCAMGMYPFEVVFQD